MKLWIKSYTEKVDDPKFCSLTWEQRGIFDALCDLAGIYDHKDDDQKETGRLDTVENVAFRLRCTEVVLSSALDAFKSHKMVHIKKGIIYVTHYPKRQERPDSSKKSAVLERVHKHRAKSVTPLQPVTPSLQDDVTPLEENRKEEIREEEEKNLPAGEPPPAPPAAEVASPKFPVLGLKHGTELATLLENHFQSKPKPHPPWIAFADQTQFNAYCKVERELNGEFIAVATTALERTRESRADLLAFMQNWVSNRKPGANHARNNNAPNQRNSPPPAAVKPVDPTRPKIVPYNGKPK